MEKLLFTFILISGGLCLGYLLQLASKKGLVLSESAIPRLRKTLQKIGLLGFFPISFMSAIWIVSLSDSRLVLFPFIGLLALVTGGSCGFLLSELFGSTQKQKGVLFCCGSFTNIGAIGGLVCYVFLGEAAFALVALYKMFEEIFYYTVGFPFARYCAQNGTKQNNLLTKLWIIITDPFVFTALFALTIGATLNLLGVERPYFFTVLCAISIPIGTFILLVSIGLGLHFSSVKEYMKHGITISIIKFIVIPMVTCTTAYLAGFGEILDGLPLKVVCIVSSMPVAFNALVAASIYDLDLDLANSCWLISTSLLLIILPWLYFISVILL